MESFRNIADETFPSFLGNSLNSSASILVENVTISSNPGLPVAASTVAKNKAGHDSRVSDIQASYLEEGKHSPPSLSSHSSQLDPEPMGRFAISFHDDMEVATLVKEPQPAIVSLRESYSMAGDQDQNVIEHSNHSQDTLLEVLPLERLEDLPTGICFLPDSKDNKVTPSEPSEKLVEAETLSDHLSISLSSFLENEKLSSLSSLGGDSTDDDIDDEEFFDNQLEAYFEQLIPPEVTRGDNDIGKLSDCCTALKLSENGLLQEDFQDPGTYQAVTGADSGNASDEDSQKQGMTGCPVQIEKLPRARRQLNSMTSRDVLESCSAADLHLDSLYLQCISSHKADGEGALSKQEVWSSEHQSAASDGEVLHPAEVLEHYIDPRIPLSADAPGTAAGSTGCEVGLSDTYLSPTADSCQNKSLATTDTGDAPHSIVYQNEEGKWVTDLAYYTSFDEEQDLNLSEDDKINEFITGSEAAAMIAQDQEEFEKTHRLLQAEKVDILNASEVANSSWKSASSCLLPKMSDVSKDASYLRLSLGEFFGQRSEALGCLGGGSNVKRPSFGYHITSPKTRQPVALLRQSEASVGDTTQETSQFSEAFPEDLEAQAKEHADSTICEGAWCSVEAAAGIQKSINTETASKSKAKDGVNEDKLEGGLSNHSDSVLSISTIASAIANASCSADPSQLAAMMMTLSNKNRKKCFLPGIVNEMELAADQALSSHVENSTFDMEKYLKKTDEIGHESERESIVKLETSAQSSMSESSLLGKVKNKESLVEDFLSDRNEQQVTEKQFLDYFNAENGTQNISSSSDASKHKDRAANSVKYSEKLSDIFNSKYVQLMSATLKSDVLDTQTSPNRNKAETCETPLAAKREMAQRLLFAQQADYLISKCCSREDEGTVDQVKNAVPEPCNDLERSTRNIVPLSNVKFTKQPGKHVSVSPTKAKPVQKLNTEETQSTKVEEKTKESSAAGSGNVKHVTFEKLSPTSQNDTEHQSVLPECDLQPLEDEQYSFRPSTSPLIHSSPSDTSGTAFSGSEADFISTSHYPKSSCKESTVSQSVYSSPSMSRLTYVSESDSTLKNTSVMCDPETHWSENASELSTTIIRASPTPSQEQTNKNLEDYLCQRNRKGIQFSVDQKSEENELAYPERKLEGKGQDLTKEDLPKNERQLTSAASKVAATLKELDPVISALASKFCVFQPLPVNVGAQDVWQDHTNKAQSQGLPSLNALPVYPGLRTCIPINQNAPGEQYIPISSFKSHVTTSESQTVSSGATLLPGHSLATTQFAQHHLGNIPSTGNKVLPQFHGCSSTGFSVPPSGLPYSSISAGRVENPVPVGIPLGSNIGPGSLGTAALCHPHSSWNKNILNIRSCTVQPLGTSRNEWDFSMSPGVGHVKVPEELKFPNACCVGIASQTALSIFNPTERWLQVSIGILSISVNGEKVDPAKYQCLVFKNKTIVGPHSTDDLKILFLPCHSGIFQCILSVSSWPLSADAETVVQAEALASRVVLTAVAENPNLEVETGKQDYLDFGDLTSGSWKALPLKIINKTHAFVPIRLIINANAVAWRCFTFSKEPVNSSNEDTVSQVAAPSVVNHVIHASYDGQDPEVLTVWVLFHAPKKQISCSDALGPAEEFLARVDVEVDSPGPSSVIESIPLRARAGTARIHAPKDLQTIHLSASVGSTAKQQLPLKNAGNIGVNLKLKTSGQDSCFSVEPDDLFLLPGEEQEVTVNFSPKNVMSTQSVLKILVLPSGPQYEVVIKGEMESVENRPVSTVAADIPPILSNKQFIAWGGVKLGESVQQKLTLRNNSPSVTQHLRLVIRGQDQDCFQLQSIFGSEERLTSNWELKIRPKEDTNIYLMFTPTRVTCFFAKLEIKQLGIRSQPGIKFTIPLSGYGGTSNIILESVKKLSDSYTLTLDELLPSRLKRVSFHIRNTGSRAAYVKALCFANLQTKTVVDPQVMTVSPEKFILTEGTHEMITVTWNPVEKERNFLKPKTLLSTICFFCGDEISRQRYRRAMMCELEVAKPIVPENSLLRNIVFDEEFQGEQLVTEVCDIPRGTNDIRLFYANMRKIILTVVGYFVVNRDVFQQSPGRHLESIRSENAARLINATLDVLPVKGPQGPPLPVKTNDEVQNKMDAQQTWAVKPEHLILLPPSISGTADTGHVQIVNNSSRMLTFELSWPAHCLTITPQHGVIEPESRALILVSPNPSLATKPSVIPWSGLVYIHCDNGQKFIKVQIREAQDASGTSSPSRRRGLFTPQSASPTVHVAKPLSAHPLTKMEIKNRSVIFPKTRAGECTESYLEMENKGDESVRWNLSSFTPPYVKAMDGTGSVYRATYSAFRCYRVSGTLEAHGKEKVSLIFFPRESGDYSQFWDLECHPVEKPSWKHKLRFQLSGTGTKAENTAAVGRASADTLIEAGSPVIPKRKVCSEACTTKAGLNEITRGVYAPEDLYTFLPTRIGESRTLKVNLRNNSFRTHLLKFLSPNEPFYIKHSKYSLRSHHYINVPVQFKPQAEGIFEGLLAVHTTKYGCINIRLCGKAIAKE